MLGIGPTPQTVAAVFGHELSDPGTGSGAGDGAAPAGGAAGAAEVAGVTDGGGGGGAAGAAGDEAGGAVGLAFADAAVVCCTRPLALVWVSIGVTRRRH